MQHKFDIYFSGEILEGEDEQQVKEAVGKLFKLSGSKLDALFSGKQKRIKKDLNVAQSGRFREVFRKVGALVHIVAAGNPPPDKNAAPRKVEETPSLWSLMPAGADLNPLPRNTGEEKSISEANIAALNIAPVSPLPQSPPPAAADIDTSALQAAPAASGSLEEFATVKEPVPIPDTSALAINSTDSPIQEDLDKQATTELPDISYLQATPAKTGSLEEFTQAKEPVPIPDISGISLDS